MDVLSPILHVLLRSIVVLFPLTVGLLAFRRLALSKSANVFIYAVMCLFAAVTAAGVLPWTLGLTPINWLLALMALACPMMWVGVILFCDLSRTYRYGPDPILKLAGLFNRQTKDRYSTLALEADKRVMTPSPIFRHKTSDQQSYPKVNRRSNSTKTLLALARDIRGNSSSDRRRPKLIAAPRTNELPFVRHSHDA